MKATLIAAAFLIPTLVLGADPTTRDTKATTDTDTYGKTEKAIKSPSEVLTKLHLLNQKGIEKATFAQATASNEQVKKFAARQLKDHQKLDKQVLDLAKEKKITLTSVGSSGGSGSMEMGSEYESTGDRPRSATPPTSDDPMGTDTTGRGSTGTGSDTMGSPPPDEDPTMGTTGSTTGTDTKTGSTGSGTTGGTGSTTQTGTANDARTSTGTTMESATEEVDTEWERLRTLSGAQFDAEYLSSTVDHAQKNIIMLQAIGKTGDRKIDKVVDQAVKNYRDHQKRAEKLQRDIRAS